MRPENGRLRGHFRGRFNVIGQYGKGSGGPLANAAAGGE